MKQRPFIALTMLGLTSIAMADDDCTKKLSAHLSNWERSLQTYSVQPLEEDFSKRLDYWKRKRAKGESDCKIWHSLPEQRAQREAKETLFGSTSTKFR
tara:strand:+ start:399 stop:692 length:294 start_codon:yes stop_codon:yes gene_type:complete